MLRKLREQQRFFKRETVRIVPVSDSRAEGRRYAVSVLEADCQAGMRLYQTPPRLVRKIASSEPG